MTPTDLIRECKPCQAKTVHKTDGRVGGRESCQAIICGKCGHASATFVARHEMVGGPVAR